VKLGILSQNPNLYSTRRLCAAAEAREHQVQVVDYARCYMGITSHKPRVLLGSEPLTFDAIIPRVGASLTFYGTAVVRQFEMMGVFSANESQAIARSRDKLRALQLLAAEGVGLPVTGFARSTKDIQGLLGLVGGAPLIVKLLDNTRGVGAVLAETAEAAESVVTAFRQLDANILVQEFISEEGGTYIRAFVVNGKVVAAMKREGPRGTLRPRPSRSGAAGKLKLTPEERHTATRSAKILGLKVAGVDLLRSNHGSVVVDVCPSPGLESIEVATGVDIASSIIAFVEENAGRGRTKDTIKV
jgi:ribosomal protein S6--L-glutamate ligase